MKVPPRIRVHSYDVFDTLIVRDCIRPETIFRRAIRLALAELGCEDTNLLEQLVALRIQAENAARRASGEGEATLHEVYSQWLKMPEVQTRNFHIEPFRRLEIAEELKCVRPVAAMQKEVLQLFEEKRRVIYMSDMYLPHDIIQQMLVSCGYPVKGNLYVSCTYGVNKFHGHLYHQVADLLKVKPSEIWHTGDKWRVDWLSARLNRVKARHWPDATANRYEQRWAAFESDDPDTPLAGSIRAARVAGFLPDASAAVQGLYASVAAPLLVGFVAWTLHLARERGLQRLYFVARDGFLLREIAQVLCEDLPDAPEIRYLYGSRQSWLLAGSTDLTRNGLSWIFIPGASTRLADVLKRMHLTYAELAEPMGQAGLTDPDLVLNAQGIEKCWAVLLGSEAQALLEERRSVQRELLRDYVTQEGFGDGSASALVDVGWSLQCQKSLKNALGNIPIPLGMYLGRNVRHAGTAEAGESVSWINEGRGEPLQRLAGALFQNAMIVEQLLTPAPHGSTRGYLRQGEQVKPIVGSPSGLLSREQFHAIHMHYLQLAKIARPYLQSTEALEAWRKTALQNFFDFFMRPTLEEAEALMSFGVSDDQNEARKIAVTHPIRTTHFWSLIIKNGLFRGRRGFFRRPFIWLGGSSRCSNLLVRALFRVSVWLGLYGSRVR